MFLLYPWKNEKFNQNIIHWTITLITPLFGIVHFKTNYNYKLSNHCFINELILVTYALISNAIENCKRQYHAIICAVSNTTTGPDSKLKLTAIGILNPLYTYEFSFWFETMNLGRSIVNIKGSQIIIPK